MASVKQIKQRIKSAKNISQITRAMELVSAAKMRKAQVAAVQSRPYSMALNELMNNYFHSSTESILKTNDTNKQNLVLLMTTSKGLCGSLNSQLFRQLLKSDLLTSSTYITLGKKGKNFISATKLSLVADFTDHQNISAIAQLIIESIQKSEYKSVNIGYNHFHSALKQEAKIEKIWPLSGIHKKNIIAEPIVEPNQAEVSQKLFEAYIENKILSAWLEAQASEHSARMFTMKQANDSAKTFISDLSLQYNAARQSSITAEIADLVTSRLAISP